MAETGHEALSVGREALLKGQDRSRSPPECPGWVERPFRRAGTGREALPNVQVGLGGPPRWPGLS